MKGIPTKDLAVIVLAAGQGKRMNNPDKAKVMSEIYGKPLIGHVLEKAKMLTDKEIVVIVGYKKNDVIEYIDKAGFNVSFIEQEEQLGTGHAVNQARKNFNDFNGDVLILCGDVPNLSYETLKEFTLEHLNNNSNVSVLSAITKNPKGYGRIIRDENGNFIKIVEEKDADRNEKEVREINSGVFLVNSKLLFSSLLKLSNNNAQNEYYLTDIVGILKNEGARVFAFAGAEFEELLGVNSPEELSRAEEYYKLKRSRYKECYDKID
jgi:bifunctional UDP-N-acetylglucosamine pyrophosphorylase / glucosamine-1-phosphate N-acetyltransferase